MSTTTEKPYTYFIPVMDLRAPRVWHVTPHERLRGMQVGEYTEFRVGDGVEHYVTVTRTEPTTWRAVSIESNRVYEGGDIQFLVRFIVSWVTDGYR